MTCDRCGSHCHGKYCSDCEFMVAREGDAEDRITGATTDGGRSLHAELEATATNHANEALAAMDSRDTETAEYHARQFAQAIVGLNRLPTQEVTH